MTTVVTSSNRSYHMFRNSGLGSVEGGPDVGYSGKAPRPSRVMYTFAVIFRILSSSEPSDPRPHVPVLSHASIRRCISAEHAQSVADVFPFPRANRRPPVSESWTVRALIPIIQLGITRDAPFARGRAQPRE